MDIVQSSPLPALSKDYRCLPNRFFSSRRRRNSLLGLAGLENTGNICFINAALQCVFNAVPLTDYFLTGVFMEEINLENVLGTKGEMAAAYAEVLEAQWLQTHECLLPKKFLSTVYKFAPQFSDGRQHDTQEFLAFFLDTLHEDLNRARGSLKLSLPPEDISLPDEEKAALSWRSYLERNSSVIVDLFQGQLKSSVTCLVCGFVSTTFDTFMYLSLPIPRRNRAVTLVDCLVEFTKDEVMTDQEWKCEKCRVIVKAKKKIDIWKVPPLLIIHLKRFYFTKSSHGKLDNRVEYPTSDLDISSYVSSPQKEPPLYNLFAKIDHDGELASGHYSALARNRKSGVWHKFEDEDVQVVSEDRVANEKAYLLLYCKVSIAEYRRQSHKLPDLWPHMVCHKSSIESEEFAPDRTGSTVSVLEQRGPQRRLKLHVMASGDLESPGV